MIPDKLRHGIETLTHSTREELREASRVCSILREIGLQYDSRNIYGAETPFMNAADGLWQLPQQLAQALVYLSTLDITRVIDIGTFNGWTTSVLTAYLRRFNPALYTVTFDPGSQFTCAEAMSALLPIIHINTGATTLAACPSDLCFIDGDHSYDSVARDYEAVGSRAKCCMFHDVFDPAVGLENVPRFWAELKIAEADSSRFLEIGSPTPGVGIMGIGIRVRRGGDMPSESGRGNAGATT